MRASQWVASARSTNSLTWSAWAYSVIDRENVAPGPRSWPAPSRHPNPVCSAQLLDAARYQSSLFPGDLRLSRGGRAHELTLVLADDRPAIAELVPRVADVAIEGHAP